MWAIFNRFELQMTKVQALKASHSGPCDADVYDLSRDSKIKRQLKKISDWDLADELREYGCWNETELADRWANEQRIIWLAACDIREESSQ